MIQEEVGTTALEQILLELDVELHKSIIPHKSSKLVALFNIGRLIQRIRPQTIHCHMRRANLFGLTAGWLARVPRRIYTRHYSTQNHKYYPKAVVIDRILNYFATTIVAPSANVRDTLIKLEKVAASKVALIHHGFDLPYFNAPDQHRIDQMKVKLNIDSKSPVIGGIARYLELKGWQYVIPAFQKFLKDAPNAVLIIANGHGPFQDEVVKLLNKLPEDSYREIGFEKDLATLYHCMDYFIHAPIDQQIEAFGQIYVEALAAGVPSIFTMSGVSHEFVRHEENALVVNFCDTTGIYNALKQLFLHPEFSLKLAANGKAAVKPFDLPTFIHKTEQLYV